jgi:hypothetical protein
METISKYEVLFAVRTGVTVLLPCVPAFESGALTFDVSPQNPQDVLIQAGKKSVLLKGMKKNHLEAALARGFIMFYETKDDEVVRCTPCNYRKN